MFYTSKSIRLHSKCLAILEMIQKVSNYIEGTKKELSGWDKCGPYDMPRLMFSRSLYENKLSRFQAIRNRLIRYYASTFCQLSEDVVKKCYPELETA